MRDIIIGGRGKVISMTSIAPRLADRYMERSTFDSQGTDIPVADSRRDNLYEPVDDDGGERGRNWHGRVMKRSIYTTATMHPRATVLIAAAAGAAIAAGLRGRRR